MTAWRAWRKTPVPENIMAKKKSKKLRKIIVFTAIGLSLIGLGLFAYFRKPEVILSVQVEPVTRRSLTEIVSANGKIQPVLQVVINPEISGEIVALPVKEGQKVEKGDLLLKIKPDNYVASTNSAHASLQGALAAETLARANLAKAEWEFQRLEKMHGEKLVSDFDFQAAKTSVDVARAQHESSTHQTKQTRASLARAMEDLSKTTIVAPIAGTITKLKSQAGERVVGSAMMAGTEIMTVANLDDMEARVDIGETDVVLIGVGQKARLEVDAFRDRKFNGTVTEIANSVKGGGSMGGGGSSQEAAKFEVKIRIAENEPFRPGMSVTAEVETRYRTNVLTVPIQSVTTRLPKSATNSPAGSNLVAHATGTNAAPAASPGSNTLAGATNTTATNLVASTAPKKAGEPPKPIEVVFVMEGDHVKMVPVKRGISDDNFTEITEGLAEGQKVISGGYKAINRDLEDGSKVKLEAAKPVGPTGAEEKK